MALATKLKALQAIIDDKSKDAGLRLLAMMELEALSRTTNDSDNVSAN